MSRLPNSPHNGATPGQIANADRRTAAVRQVVDELLADTELPSTDDRTEAVVSLSLNELTFASLKVCVLVGADPADWADMAECAIAAELLYRALKARQA